MAMILTAQKDIEIVGECVDGVQAVDTVRATRPDVALLDIRMPRLDGLQAARLLTRSVSRNGPPCRPFESRPDRRQGQWKRRPSMNL